MYMLVRESVCANYKEPRGYKKAVLVGQTTND